MVSANKHLCLEGLSRLAAYEYGAEAVQIPDFHIDWTVTSIFFTKQRNHDIVQ